MFTCQTRFWVVAGHPTPEAPTAASHYKYNITIKLIAHDVSTLV